MRRHRVCVLAGLVLGTIGAWACSSGNNACSNVDVPITVEGDCIVFVQADALCHVVYPTDAAACMTRVSLYAEFGNNMSACNVTVGFEDAAPRYVTTRAGCFDLTSPIDFNFVDGSLPGKVWDSGQPPFTFPDAGDADAPME
jgi:hypothetical protein